MQDHYPIDLSSLFSQMLFLLCMVITSRTLRRCVVVLAFFASFEVGTEYVRFFFIAGHTPGGAPYGVTWEEMGLEPFDEYP